MIRWVKSIIAVLRIAKCVPFADVPDWTAEDTRQLRTFLQSTSAGAKLIRALQKEMSATAVVNSTDKDADEVLRNNGITAGYVAVLGIIEQLSNGTGEIDTSE